MNRKEQKKRLREIRITSALLIVVGILSVGLAVLGAVIAPMVGMLLALYLSYKGQSLCADFMERLREEKD